MVDELRRGRPERLEQAPVQRLVRPVVEAADDVGDAEVDVVDHGGELIGGTSVGAEERDSVEAVAELGARLPVALRALALAHRALVPLEPEPLQVPDDLLLAPREVPSRIRVVDAEQHPVAQLPVCDGAEGVPDVQ